jgi:MurNAc alpha-1-phosphate uridylyltransferase
MKAMILAAGLGTRLRPLTVTTPKALVNIGGYTLLELAIRYLKKYGIQDMVINVHHFAGQIIHYLEENKGFGVNYSVSDETGQLMDTGGAIVKASKFLKGIEPFILMGSDILTNLDLGAMIRHHQSNRPLVTLAVKERPTSRSLLFDGNMNLIGWRDNSTGLTRGENVLHSKYALGFSVIQIIEPTLFSMITEKGSFSIIDLYIRLMETERIIGFRHDESIWLELGRADKIDTIVRSNEFSVVVNSL